MSEDAKAIVEALKGIRTTLGWCAVWLFLIMMELPSTSSVVDALKKIAEKLK